MKLTSKEYAAFKVVQLVAVLVWFPIMQNYGPSVLGWSGFESWIAALLMGVVTQNLSVYIMKDWAVFLAETATETETEKEA